MKEALKKLFQPRYLILLIILLAAFFRFYQIDATPPGLYPDVAVNGTNAITANETGNYRLFYTDNNGREGLWINLIALSFKTFGVGLWQLRIVGAIFGTLTVWGIYLLTKELLNQKAAFYASAFLATSFWAVNFSRIGFRAIMVPFIIVFALYFLMRNFTSERKPYSDFILSGLITGLGFHTYISFRVFPVVPVLILLYTFVTNRELFKSSWKKYLLYFMAVVLIALPMFLYFQFNSSEAAVRTGQVSILNPDINKGNLLGLALKTTLLSLGMFNFYGDQNWRHNLVGMPTLNYIVGIFFLIGIFSLVKVFFSRKESREKKVSAWALGATFFLMLVPAIMTEEGMPHSLRSIGSMIPVFIMAGWGAFLFFDWLIKKNKKLSLIMPIAIIVVILSDLVAYFGVWAKKQEVVDQFTSSYVEMGKLLNSYPDDFDKYVIVNKGHTVLENGFTVDGETIRFITYGKSKIKFLKVSDLETLKIDNKSIIIPTEHNREVLSKVKASSQAPIVDSEVNTTNPKTSFRIYLTQ